MTIEFSHTLIELNPGVHIRSVPSNVQGGTTHADYDHDTYVPLPPV
jgi:hypothetical protein